MVHICSICIQNLFSSILIGIKKLLMPVIQILLGINWGIFFEDIFLSLSGYLTRENGKKGRKKTQKCPDNTFYWESQSALKL